MTSGSKEGVHNRCQHLHGIFTRHLYGYMLLTSSGKSAGLNSGDKPTQLRDLAAALRKAEEVDDKLRALKNLEGALLAAPDELKHYAGQLTLFSII